MPPSIFMAAPYTGGAGRSGAHWSVTLAAQVPLEFGGELVPRGQGLDPEGVALGGVDALLELAHHGRVLALPAIELVHLATRRVGRAVQPAKSRGRSPATAASPSTSAALASGNAIAAT